MRPKPPKFRDFTNAQVRKNTKESIKRSTLQLTKEATINLVNITTGLIRFIIR